MLRIQGPSLPLPRPGEPITWAQDAEEAAGASGGADRGGPAFLGASGSFLLASMGLYEPAVVGSILLMDGHYARGGVHGEGLG